MADQTAERYGQIKAFQDLIRGTMDGLHKAVTPHALATELDARIPAWEGRDAEFAGVLKELRGQAFHMSLPHIRTVVEKLCAHLQVNLDRIEKDVRRVTR
jgi:hypothetical protein